MTDPMGDLFTSYGGTIYAPAAEPLDTATDPELLGQFLEFDVRSQLLHPTSEAFGPWPGGGRPTRPRAADNAAVPPARPADPPSGRRRRAAAPTAPRVLNSLLEVLTGLTVTAVCLLDYLLSYGPLQHLAYPRVPSGLAQPWPIIIYGPWLAGCLSVLRAALEGRHETHSWVVIVLFSTIATALCIAGVPRTWSNAVVAGLPPVTAAAALHQLVRQLGRSRARISKRPPSRGASHRAPRSGAVR